VLQAFRMLEPGGMFVMTAAGPGRAPHSAVDGKGLQPGEHYANIDPGGTVDVAGGSRVCGLCRGCSAASG